MTTVIPSNLDVLVDQLKSGFGLDETDPDVVKIIEEGEWTQDHKYQSCVSFVEVGGEAFSITENRSGSYHTDWYYDDTIVTPVEKHIEMKPVTTWKVSGPHVFVPRGD